MNTESINSPLGKYFAFKLLHIGGRVESAARSSAWSRSAAEGEWQQMRPFVRDGFTASCCTSSRASGMAVARDLIRRVVGWGGGGDTIGVRLHRLAVRLVEWVVNWCPTPAPLLYCVAIVLEHQIWSFEA